MARRRKKGTNGASLDSLLDTMTNVVGILIIVLVVTQLGVGDAVNRITKAIQITPEDVERARQAAAEAARERESLATQLAALKKGDSQQQLRELQQQIKAQNDKISAVLKQREGEAAAATAKANEMKKLADEYESRQKELTDKLAAAEEQLAALLAVLEETPDRPVLDAKVVNLPNPRAAPESAKPLYFICREGKLYFWDRSTLQERAQKQAEFLVRSKGLARNPKTGIEAEKLIPLFDRQRLNDDTFVLKLEASGRNPMLVFERKRSAGLTTEEIQNPRSPAQRMFDKIDPAKYYLRFTVWPDSFETYVAARQQATKRGILAGWDVSGSEDEPKLALGGPIKFGLAPPPNPNAPKPPPNPNRPVPVDTID